MPLNFFTMKNNNNSLDDKASGNLRETLLTD